MANVYVKRDGWLDGFLKNPMYSAKETLFHMLQVTKERMRNPLSLSVRLLMPDFNDVGMGLYSIGAKSDDENVKVADVRQDPLSTPRYRDSCFFENDRQ